MERKKRRWAPQLFVVGYQLLGGRRTEDGGRRAEGGGQKAEWGMKVSQAAFRFQNFSVRLARETRAPLLPSLS
jgi:hypothetical protein